MFVQQITFTPALGKQPELQALLLEQAGAEQAQGIRTTLTTRLFNPDGPTLQLGLNFADLAALGQHRKRNAATPAFQAFQKKLYPLLSRPTKVDLFEVLVSNPGQAITLGMCYQSAISTPVFGMGPELQAVLAERVKALQAQGRGGTLRSQLFNPAGPVFVQIRGFADLAAFEQDRKARSTDADYQTFQAKADALRSGPPEVRLVEALIAVPASA